MFICKRLLPPSSNSTARKSCFAFPSAKRLREFVSILICSCGKKDDPIYKEENQNVEKMNIQIL